MEYTKPALTFGQQADQLIARGLLGDRDMLIQRLQAVSYYRLSGYLYPFRSRDDSFRPGTTLDQVWEHYTFDRRLRLVAMDAIERVEVALRTRFVYEHVHRHGPFGYTSPATLPKLDGNRFGRFLSQVYEETTRSKEIFVKHFWSKYGDKHGYLPLWMVAEIMPFGATLTLFTGSEPDIKRCIADSYGVPDVVFHSWVRALTVVRNICAHHGRLWNRELGVKPKIPNARKYPEWHTPIEIPNNRIFGTLSILKHMHGIVAPRSQWPKRLLVLLDEHAQVSRTDMGFPRNWETSPIWRDATARPNETGL